ncbi:hypothetical protein PGUG_01733 [Meyerozyma guilliermondii ATCC 6260]|uniref:Ribonuclease H2 subunit B n=1 Tax=Meyerozyma guilliermondii (strain ATCC 6260 / CBS 566 / DSM 6381 / JCM 1539 / NBRC 10279 / NRRL Y-324) TaxID=294746 RepID=A5DEN2_PICGU|nr:uncharacterized protein PGUG_01733 [Meyerozyma guilliermondii ATCC 6260]EDK37635.2 hypothetical protein PGUG_01733 [Meyerozyma guilliermondii ATCC 6260]
MLVHSDTRIFLLPASLESTQLDIIQLPLANKSVASFLVKENQVFELKNLGSKNPWLKNDKSVTLPRTGGAVKSLIIETDESGAVLQSPDMIMATKFDLSFIFITIMAESDTFSKRYISYQDILDTIGSQNPWINDLSDTLIINCLGKICETVVENQETFYKYSSEKTAEMLSEKVNKLEKSISNSSFVINDTIRQILHDPSSANLEIPSDIYNLAVMQHCIDLVCCYIPFKVRESVIKKMGSDFSPLDAYMKELKQKKKALDAAEQAMNEVAASTANAKKANAKLNGKANGKTKPKKKQVAKVAVGKGALDGFFKRS